MMIRAVTGRIRRAFTLVELLLAITVSSIIGLTTLLMLDGMIGGTQSQIDTRRSTIRREAAIVRLGSLCRNAAMLLAVEDQHIVLWTGDSHQNDLPDLSELRRIEWNDATSEIELHESPDNLDPSLDQTFDFDDNFSTITAAAAGSPEFLSRIVLRDVVNWNLTSEPGSTVSIRLTRLDITVQNETGDDIATIVSSLRVPAQ